MAVLTEASASALEAVAMARGLGEQVDLVL
jgi:hypothetical protein